MSSVLVKIFTVYVLITLFSYNQAQAKDTYIRGFYHGQNVFIRNEFRDNGGVFCIQAIYVNGELQVEKPNISAVEINLSALSLNERVVLRIVHLVDCSPKLINPEVIQDDLSFSWVKFYVNEHELLWVTSFEDKEGYYIVEKEVGNLWEPLDTVQTIGNIFINQHSLKVDHIPGNNLYRLVYYTSNKPVNISNSFQYFSDRREISHAVDTDNWIIEFTKEVAFQILNANGRVLKRGKQTSCDIKKLPRGNYILKYEDKEVGFAKTSRSR